MRVAEFAILALTCCVSLATQAVASTLSVGSVLGSHMVVQREQPIVIWGQAVPGQDVSVSMGELSASTRADDAGAWRLNLPAQRAGGPHTIMVSSGDERVHMRNVLIGDVWLCSGQSNMHWRMDQSDLGEQFIQGDLPASIRVLQIKKTWDREPQAEAETIGWRTLTPESAARFSAVGFHFGRLINEQIDVPIGLIQSSWGGTPAEAWTPMPELERRPDVFADRLASLRAYDLEPEQAEQRIEEAQSVHEAYATAALERDQGLAGEWQSDATDQSEWEVIEVDGYLPMLNSFDGVLWLRREVVLPASADGAAGELRLGRIDDYDEAWVNGVKVGSTLVDQGDGRRIDRRYAVPTGVLRAGSNTIAMRLLDVRSGGGFIPDGKPFEIAAGETVLALEGLWRARIGFSAQAERERFPRSARYAVEVGRPYRRPAVLYNAMIHPIRNLGLSGAIWYQGESNSGREAEYLELMSSLIVGWRRVWSQEADRSIEFPFYFVQLPNYRDRSETPRHTSWAGLREAQRQTLDRVANTGMAITIDIGDPVDIHPTNKLPVAERLARLALRGHYGVKHIVPSGPLPIEASSIGEGAVRVRFAHAQQLTTPDNQPLQSFALAGQDGVFHWAQATIDQGGSVVLRSHQVSQPAIVRYAWDDNPAVNLVNQEGLPASPFELSVVAANPADAQTKGPTR
ncbi:MAG: sialate O-acetylesterase [Planctomycetota bacterium]